MSNTEKQAAGWPDWLNSAAIAEAAQKAFEQSKDKTATDPARAKQMGEDILKYTLGGLGLGLAGTRIHHALTSQNTPKSTHTKFGPGPYPVEEDEKIAAEGLAATLKSMYDSAVSMPGKAIQTLSEPKDQNAAFMSAMLAGSGLGIYGGHSIMSAILDKKRKEDLKSNIEDAKKEYQRALISKKYAADIDAAFSSFKKTAADGSWTSWLMSKLPSAGGVANSLFDPLRLDPTVWNSYVASALGVGALSGKMTYDWTRARSKDKALDSARKARARMSGVAPIYVDPEQLAAIKKIAD
jgi:hypothetical protein